MAGKKKGISVIYEFLRGGFGGLFNYRKIIYMYCMVMLCMNRIV